MFECNDPRDLRQVGFKSGAYEFIEQVLSLDSLMIRNEVATFFWRVRGDEVRILGLKDGDLLIVDRSVDPHHGSLVVCVVDDKHKVRRLRRWGKNLVPVPLKHSERVDPYEDVEVWGVVVGMIRNY